MTRAAADTVAHVSVIPGTRGPSSSPSACPAPPMIPPPMRMPGTNPTRPSQIGQATRSLLKKRSLPGRRFRARRYVSPVVMT